MLAAHISGVPVEELVAPLAGSGAALLTARALLAVLLNRRSDL